MAELKRCDDILGAFCCAWEDVKELGGDVGDWVFEHRWQIVGAVTFVGCELVTGGGGIVGCGAAAAAIAGRAKQVEVTVHEATAPDGWNWSRYGKNTLFNAGSTLLSAPGGIGRAFSAGCAASSWCSNPYWDDPWLQGDEAFLD